MKSINNYQVLIKKINVSNMDDLKSVGDQIYQKLSNGIAALFCEGEGKPIAVVIVGKNLTNNGFHAGEIAKHIGLFMDGGGGGKPHMATAGGKNIDSILNAINKTNVLIHDMLEGK